MNRRSPPEADAQRAIVQVLRFDAIVHHCANEVTDARPRGPRRQSILVGMGVHAGFADLIVISGGGVLFPLGQKRNRPLAQITGGLSRHRRLAGLRLGTRQVVDDALGALADNGFTSRAQPARRVAP
jgi:hypothetical protein